MSTQEYFCLKCGYIQVEPKADCPRCYCTAWGKKRY